MRLAAIPCEIIYRKGSLNQTPDALSRIEWGKRNFPESAEGSEDFETFLMVLDEQIDQEEYDALIGEARQNPDAHLDHRLVEDNFFTWKPMPLKEEAGGLGCLEVVCSTW